MDQKPIYLWPGDKRILDGTRPVVYINQIIVLGAFGLLLSLGLAFALLWIFSEKPQLVTKMDLVRSYLSLIHNWFTDGQPVVLTIRKGIAGAIGLAGAWFFSRSAWTPVDLTTQVRGRKLLKGMVGFNDLKAVMDRQIRTSAKGLIMATRSGFNLLKPETYFNAKHIMWMSDQARRVHFLVIGGTRRGKGVKTKEIIMQIYYHKIKRKMFPFTSWLYKIWDFFFPRKKLPRDNYKLFIVDTPKGEYAELFDKKDMQQIAPDEKFSVPHAIQRDLRLVQDVAQFAAGLIPVSDKDPFWGTAGRGAVTGIGAFLIKEAGRDWSYNNFAYFKDMPVSELAVILSKYHPSINQIMNMGEGSLGSVMGQVASNLAFMNDVADIWDGYQYKVAIHQMSAALLKRKFWMEWFVERAFPSKAVMMIDDKETEVSIPYNICTSSLILSHICHLNSVNPKWKWVDLKAALQEPWAKQVEKANIHAKAQLEHVHRAYIAQHLKNITPILEYAEIWDGFEGRERFSIREWLLDENPAKRVFLLKPSGRFKSQLEGVIRGILFYMTSMINDKYFQEDKTEILPMRNLHIVCDEFQSLGNLKEFIAPALEMFASKGVTVYLCLQDFSQIKSVYDENFLNFIQANTGNIYIMGMNQGTSAEMVSNLVGKKSISKTHTSKTMQETGTSTSINNQVHDNEMVITPDEINAFLGTKGNEIHYLYLPGNEANAYLLTSPVVRNYPKLYKPEAASWMKGVSYKPALVDLAKVQAAVFATGGEGKDIDETLHYMSTQDVVHDAASEMTEEDFTPEELDAMKAAMNREERAPYYPLPTESEGMQGTIMKDMAADFLGGGVATAVSHAAEILTDAKRNVTTSKAKYHREWKLKKEREIEQFTKD